MAQRVYIETYGCQMNVADSELMAGLLGRHGFTSVKTPEEADVVLINTCAVREKAEDRIFGRLGWLKPLKDSRPELVLGVAGCMAEHLKEALVKRAPYVDIVVGPDAYRRLPALINEVQAGAVDSMIDVRLDREELYEGERPHRALGVSGWISIMRGCDKFCTFCIVPYTRGRERSVSPDEIVQQAEEMVAQGFKEVTLLGQTVSSYLHEGCDFAALLRRLHAVEGLARIRYTSPYPSDFTDGLLETLAELPRVARHLHLPLQSGSSRVLEAMRRGYTIEDYLSLARTIRQQMPDFSITTDLIVGYPTETEDEFEATLRAVEEVQFDSAYMFKYSERSGTWAAKNCADEISEAVKSDRLTRLIKLQEQCSIARSARMVGKTVEVLVTGTNPKNDAQKMGRSSCFKTTGLEGDHRPGDMVKATVTSARTHTLFATPVAN